MFDVPVFPAGLYAIGGDQLVNSVRFTISDHAKNMKRFGKLVSSSFLFVFVDHELSRLFPFLLPWLSSPRSTPQPPSSVGRTASRSPTTTSSSA
jgi:hypothetical protein